MPERFKPQLEHSCRDAQNKHRVCYSVQDTRAKEFNLPERACPINMSRDAAYKIAELLNMEWNIFQRDPW